MKQWPSFRVYNSHVHEKLLKVWEVQSHHLSNVQNGSLADFFQLQLFASGGLSMQASMVASVSSVVLAAQVIVARAQTCSYDHWTSSSMAWAPLQESRTS